MHSTSPVVVPGPLAPFAAGFDAELARLGYTPDSAYGQLRLAAELSAWLASAGMGLAEVTAKTLEVFAAGRHAGGRHRGRTGRAFAPLVDYLRGLAVIPPAGDAVATGPADQLLARYRSYRSVSGACRSGPAAATCIWSARSWPPASSPEPLTFRA